MAEFEAKAKAIWSALDEMAAKSPDMYKQFINDQLNGEGAQEMMKQLNLGPDFAASLSSASRKMASKPTTKSENVSGSSRRRSVLTTSSGRKSTGSVDSKEEQEQADCQSSNSRTNSLLDDTFVQPNSNLLLNPFLAQIVAEDEEDQVLLTELKLPEEGNGDKNKTKKPAKVLIEEL